MGLNHQQNEIVEPKSIWPDAVTRNSSGHTSQAANTSGMPDYLVSTMEQAIGSDQLGMASITMDEDGIIDNLKVPTNTPIIANDGSAGATGL